MADAEPPFGGLIREVADYHGELLRNIKGIRVTQALFDDLSEDPADQAVAVAADTAGRVPSPAPLITRPFDYGTVITYPFVPHNWHPTRYSDGLAHGVWYGSFEIQTTVFESVYHWHRFVMDAYAGENRPIQADRRVFSVRCEAILVDLRGKEAAQPALADRNDYGYTQRLGRYLKGQGQNGLLAKSARCDGTNAAILRQEVLSAVRDACYLTYWMNPAEDHVRVERTPGATWLSIAPSALY